MAPSGCLEGKESCLVDKNELICAVANISITEFINQSDFDLVRGYLHSHCSSSA